MSTHRPAMASVVRLVDDRAVKRPMRLLLRLGLAPNAFAMLETTGRRTGALRRLDARALESTIRLLDSTPRVVRILVNDRGTPAVGPARVGRLGTGESR